MNLCWLKYFRGRLPRVGRLQVRNGGSRSRLWRAKVADSSAQHREHHLVRRCNLERVRSPIAPRGISQTVDMNM